MAQDAAREIVKEKKIHLASSGKPMTAWQIWLRRLCLLMIGWAALELIFGALAIAANQLIPTDVLDQIVGSLNLGTQQAWIILGVSALVGAFLDVVIAFLGLRAAYNPKKISLFFWIAFVDALLTAWAMASNISQGTIDPASIGSSLFIIALAVCAWQVRAQTGYFDRHP